MSNNNRQRRIRVKVPFAAYFGIIPNEPTEFEPADKPGTVYRTAYLAYMGGEVKLRLDESTFNLCMQAHAEDMEVTVTGEATFNGDDVVLEVADVQSGNQITDGLGGKSKTRRRSGPVGERVADAA